LQAQTLFTLLLSIFIALLGIGIIVPVIPVYAESLGASGFALGMIIAAFSISRGLLMPYTGSLSDSVGKKRFLIAGLLIYAVVGLLIPMATKVSHLLLIRFFHGIGSAMIVPIAMAYISTLSPKGFEGRYMSYLNIAMFSGMGCGPILGGIIYDTLGFHAVFYMMALMSLIACGLIIKNLSEEKPEEKKKPANIFACMSAMIKNRRTLGILIVRYSTMIVMVPSMAFLPLLMTNYHESTGTLVGIIIACRTFVNAALQIPFGKLTDKYDKLTLLLCGIALMILALLIIPSTTSVIVIGLSYSLMGIGEAIIWPVLGAYATIEARNEYGHGAMMGFFNLSMSAGVLTGAILAGCSMDLLGIYWSFYSPAIFIAIASVVGSLLIHRSSREVVSV